MNPKLTLLLWRLSSTLTGVRRSHTVDPPVKGNPFIRSASARLKAGLARPAQYDTAAAAEAAAAAASAAAAAAAAATAAASED